MTRETRTYELKRRAETQAQTRQRIIDSAAELHTTLGPARTSIKAVAEHAGVPRSTVYRHFKDETALIVACAISLANRKSAARPQPLDRIANPDKRLQRALTDLYHYYGETGLVLDNIFRDEAEMPIITELLVRFREYIVAAQDILMGGRHFTTTPNRRRTSRAIGHALNFTTWRSLTRDNHATDQEAIDLMTGLITTASQP